LKLVEAVARNHGFLFFHYVRFGWSFDAWPYLSRTRMDVMRLMVRLTSQIQAMVSFDPTRKAAVFCRVRGNLSPRLNPRSLVCMSQEWSELSTGGGNS
jgi:hypothetical protein